MSLWSRLGNVFRGERLTREIDEELESPIAEAIEHGRDLRLAVWFDSLHADAVFGWRQLKKRKITSAAAVLSLALAIGACTSAFRLIDALLLRPLPVAHPERLYVAARQGFDPGGNFRISDSCEYPLFRRMRAAVKDEAELIAVSYAERMYLTYASDGEMERANVQYVSGWMFPAFGLQPAAGRLFTENDDVTPGAHPYAVLSHDYWTRRFGQDPKAAGRSLRLGNGLYEIIGVAGEGFTGTEPGAVTDIFIPAMMHSGVMRSDQSWFRPLVALKKGAAVEPVRSKLHTVVRSFQEERAKEWPSASKLFLDRFLNQTLLLEPASAGISGMQGDYRRPLIALGALVALVLWIACTNAANLMTAQAAARAREMALRVSIGAGRWRLIQLILMESAWMGVLAAGTGGIFSWWAAPFVVSRINPPDNPARLFLPADWRVLGFGVALAIAVTFLLGLAPALRASSIKPSSALRGGGNPHARRRLMYLLVAIQVAFCLVVHFAANLFVTSLDRLANQPTGFSSERLLVLDTSSRHGQPPAAWDEVAERLRRLPGVETAALAGWPLLSGNGWNGLIWVNGAPTDVLAYFLGVSPEWTETMKIPLIDGRGLRPDERYPGAAIVNEAFAKQCFGGANPIGKWFEKWTGNTARVRFQVVGLVRDARYRNMREPITPAAYVPFHSTGNDGAPQTRSSGTLLVRTSTANPLALASVLRQEVPRARPEFRVDNLRTQEELNQQHTIRERLLAMLALFFAAVALLLAGIGLYGVLDYSVLQQRREIAIRMAIGAEPSDIVRRVTAEVFSMVLAGALAGVALSLASVRYINTLLYQVKATDPAIAGIPPLVILAVAALAASPAVFRAIRIDPAITLRTE